MTSDTSPRFNSTEGTSSADTEPKSFVVAWRVSPTEASEVLAGLVTLTEEAGAATAPGPKASPETTVAVASAAAPAR
ncbi:hypothetical protein ASF17_14620 [Frigoribacterium sp. Leaf263]|nr:hypothetical protein ASF17_14620 [Frigoribacterium sp. Leaf263]